MSPENSNTKKEVQGRTIIPWTNEENEILIEAVKTFGRSWTFISQKVLHGRAPMQCRNHYLNKINPEITLAPWTKDQDDQLIKAVNKIGNKWTELAISFPGKTPVQCFQRFRRVLDPKIKHSRWTPAEDAILIQGHQSHGNKWAVISNDLPGRSAEDCYNRFKIVNPKKIKTSKKRTRKESESTDEIRAEPLLKKQRSLEPITFSPEQVDRINNEFITNFFSTEKLEY